MKIMGLDPTRVTENSEFTLGTEGEDDRGRAFVYVKADAALAVGDVAIIDEDFGVDGVDTTNAEAGAGYGKPCGCVMAAMASGEFGWLARKGTGSDIKAAVAASAVKYTRLRVTATAGELDDTTTATTPYIAGLVVTATDAGSGSAIQAVLDYPRVELDLIA